MNRHGLTHGIAAGLVLSFGVAVGISRSEDPSVVDVEDVRISVVDFEGRTVTPLASESGSESVLLFVTHDCPISNAYSPEIQRIRQDYEKKGFVVFLVYVDPDATQEEIRKHLRDYSLKGFRVIHDRRHRLVKATGARVTPEAVVVGAEGKIHYRGRIDNMYAALGKRRRVVTAKDLRAALDSVRDGSPILNSRTEAVGCFIPSLN